MTESEFEQALRAMDRDDVDFGRSELVDSLIILARRSFRLEDAALALRAHSTELRNNCVRGALPCRDVQESIERLDALLATVKS